MSRAPRTTDGVRHRDPDDFEISVARDSSSTVRQFLVVTAHGPLRPEDYVREYLLRHDATCCYRTKNDCWEVLAGRVARASARGAGGLMQTVAIGDGYRNLDRKLGEDGYAAFLQEVLKQVEDPAALWKSYEAYRKALDRRLPAARAEVLHGFLTELLPHFTPTQIVSIVGLVYTGATGFALRGMPDLTAVKSGRVLLVTVKSPGDRTSDIQRGVHDFLSGLGLQVLTCRLTERGAYPWERPSEAETEHAEGAGGGATPAGAAIATELEAPVITAPPRRCAVCGLSLSDSATFCPVCGIPARSPAAAPPLCAVCGQPLISLEDVSVCGRCRYSLENTRRRRIEEAEEPVHEAWTCRVRDPDRAAALYRQSIHRFLSLDQETLDSPQARRALLYVFDRLSNLLKRGGLQVEALETIEWAASLGLLDDDDAGTKAYRDSLRKRRDGRRRTASQTPHDSDP